MDGLLAAPLGILKERHQKERDDGRGRVDEQLVGVEVVHQEVARRPRHHQRHAEGEERSPADVLGASLSEPVEESPPGFLPYLRGPALAHALLLLSGLGGRWRTLLAFVVAT